MTNRFGRGRSDGFSDKILQPERPLSSSEFAKAQLYLHHWFARLVWEGFMRAIFKYSLAVAAILFPSFSQAGDPPHANSATCLAPMKPDDPPVVMRDIRFTLKPDKKTVSMQMCIASSEKRGIAQYSANLAVFRSNGEFLATGGSSPTNIPPLNGGPDKPAVVILFAADATIDPRYSADLLPQTVVQGGWMACKDGPPAPCVADKTNNISFLLPVTIVPTTVSRGRR